MIGGMRHVKNLKLRNNIMARGRVFTNPKKKAEMLNLRKQGHSYIAIGKKYGVDHTTILYHCKIAGFILSKEMRNSILSLIKQGDSQEKVARELQINRTVVEFYCCRYGLDRDKLFSRTPQSTLKPLVLQIPQKEKTVTAHYTIKRTPRNIKIRVDDRGVEWIQNEHGEWKCMGKTAKQYQQGDIARKKKILELKRKEMLSY